MKRPNRASFFIAMFVFNFLLYFCFAFVDFKTSPKKREESKSLEGAPQCMIGILSYNNFVCEDKRFPAIFTLGLPFNEWVYSRMQHMLLSS